jgi:hypothetical protein
MEPFRTKESEKEIQGRAERRKGNAKSFFNKTISQIWRKKASCGFAALVKKVYISHLKVYPEI